MARGTGFGSMNKEKLREMQSRGGKATAQSGKKFVWTSEQAREAAKKSQEVRRLNKLKKQQEEEDDADSV